MAAPIRWMRIKAMQVLRKPNWRVSLRSLAGVGSTHASCDASRSYCPDDGSYTQKTSDGTLTSRAEGTDTRSVTLSKSALIRCHAEETASFRVSPSYRVSYCLKTMADDPPKMIPAAD